MIRVPTGASRRRSAAARPTAPGAAAPRAAAHPTGLRATTLLPALVAALASAACGDVSEGVAGDGSLDGADAPLALEAEPVYSVGAIEGAAWETFSNVEGVAFDGSGNLHVFDPENHRVVVVGPDGSHVRSVGRAGEGPGELQSPETLGVTHDGRLVVGDVRAQAFHRFSAGGEFEEQVRFEGTYGFPVTGTALAPGGDAVIAVGQGILFRTGPGGGSETEDPTFVPVRRISLADGSDSTVYRAWLPPEPGEGEQETVEGDGGRRISISMTRLEAFRPRTHVGVLPDGSLVVVDSTDWSLDVLDADGTHRETLRRPLAPAPVDEETRRLERERRLAALEEDGGPRLIGPAGAGLQDQFREMRRRQIENMAFADVVPVIADLAVDWDGRIWIERTGERPGEDGPIDVVAADGTYHGTIEPGGLRIPDAFGPDGLAAYVETDELDVPRVVVRRIATPLD